MFVVATVSFVVITATVAAVITAGVRQASRRAGASPHAWRAWMGAVAAWLVVVSMVAASGVLLNFRALPPRMFLIVGGGIAWMMVASRSATFGRLLDAAPRSWPIALQTMRVPIELGLFALHAAGRLPSHLTFEGRNFDVLVGLTAPIVAYGVHRGWLGGRAIFAWNVASLGFLVNIVGMAVTTFPGPLHMDWPGVSNEVMATWPFVWLPGFLVPVALMGHVTSLRQLLRSRTASSVVAT